MRLTPGELAAQIAHGEGKQLEFKRGLPRDEKTARTLAAFANTRGGLLLIGVGDRGEVIGAPKPHQTLERLRGIAENTVSPPVAIDVGVVELEARTIVCCSVALSPKRPHAVLRAGAEPEIVVRAGSSNRAADGATLKALKRQRGSKKGLDELSKRALAWVERESRNGSAAQSSATVAAFCEAFNIGKQRARRAFINLEREGLLVGHGFGARRVFSRS